MAHPRALREYSQVRTKGLRRPFHAYFLAGLDHVPTPCLLCQGRSHGGHLCRHCHVAVTQSMRGPRLRCTVCCLALGGAGTCPDCAARTPAFSGIVAAFDYAMPGDLLIHQLKVEHRYATAGALARLMADAMRCAGIALPAHTILVPVPASRASIRRRGFNPAGEIARCLARRLDLPCRPMLLRRMQEGGRQTHLTRRERSRSAAGLYACTQRLDGRCIAVVDDVLTTGSTMHSIALELRAAGAASVLGLVAARTPF
ncbi:MAG TPA: ComF family protein [Candidimonas sp.]|nr:ComF family protein [Candidimonas sp.]